MNNEFDFELQKRKTKLMITNDVIDKVPCTHILDNGGPLDIKIKELHQELLRVAKMKNNSNEVGFLVNLKDWSFIEILGTVNGVSMYNISRVSYILKNSYPNTFMFMHNHPNNSVFSGPDLVTFLGEDTLYLATAIGNNGNVHIMKKGPYFNKESVLFEYNKHVNDNKGVMYILQHCTKFDLYYKFGRHSK